MPIFNPNEGAYNPNESIEEKKRRQSTYSYYGPNLPGVVRPEPIKPSFSIPPNMKMYSPREMQAGLPAQEGFKPIPWQWGLAASKQFSAPNMTYFTNDPKRLAKFYYFMKAAPPDWQAPDWMDPQAYEEAFNYLSTTQGTDWTKWEQYDPDDPSNIYLNTLSEPPRDFQMPGEWDNVDDMIEQIALVSKPKTAGMTQDEYDKLLNALYAEQGELSPFLDPEKGFKGMEIWEQHGLSLFNPQPMPGRPEWTRIPAAGMQALFAAGGGAAIGRLVGGVPGAIVGGAAVGIGTFIQAYANKKIPGLNEFLEFMDIGAVATEKLIGVIAQAKGGDLQEVLENFFAEELTWEKNEYGILTPHFMGPSWKTGELAYEASPVGTIILNSMSKGYQLLERVLNANADVLGINKTFELSSGMTADYKAGEVWALEKAISEPVMMKHGLIGGEALDQIRSELIRDPDSWQDLYNEYISEFGFSGNVGDFFLQMILDPAQIAAPTVNALGRSYAKRTGNMNMLYAFDQNYGAVGIDALPLGWQQLGSFLLQKKATGGIFDTMKIYKNVLQHGTLPMTYWSDTKKTIALPLDITNPETFSIADSVYNDILTKHAKLDEAKGVNVISEADVAVDFRQYIEGELKKLDIDVNNADISQGIDQAISELQNERLHVVNQNLGESQEIVQTALTKATKDVLDRNLGWIEAGSTEVDAKMLPEITPWERRFAKLTDEGAYQQLQPQAATNWFKRLGKLSPESQAVLTLNLLLTNTSAITQIGGADVVKVANLIKQIGGADVVTVGQITEAMIHSPASKTVAPIIKAFVETGSLDQSLAAYLAVDTRRQSLIDISKPIGYENEVNKLLQTIEDHPQQVINLLKNVDESISNPAVKDLVNEINTGTLNAETLLDRYKVFWENEGIPLSPGQWTAEMMSNLSEFADGFMVDHFGIKTDPFYNRISSSLKHLMSLAVLGFNPLYAAYNFENNLVSRAVQGVFGMMTPKQIDRLWKKVGIKPAQLSVGIGLAGEVEYAGRGLKKVAAALQGDDWLTKINRVTKKAAKLGIISTLAGKIEVAESRQATTIGFLQFFNKSWKDGLGYSKMPMNVEAELKSINPQLPNLIYGLVNDGMRMEDITKSLYTRSKFRGVNGLIDEAISRIAGDSSQSVMDLFDKTGLREELKEYLPTNRITTEDDIRMAFNAIRGRMDSVITQAISDSLINRTRVEDGRNRVTAEGGAGMMPLVAEMYAELEARRLLDMVENQAAAESADAYRSDKNWTMARDVWRQRFLNDAENWKTTKAFMLQTAEGMFEASEYVNPEAHEYIISIRTWLKDWDKFYADRNLEYRKFYGSEQKLKGKARDGAYKAMQENIAKLYDAHRKGELATKTNMFENLAAWYEASSQRPAAEIRAWGNQVIQSFDSTSKMIAEFRESIRNTDLSIQEIRSAFNTFNKESFKPALANQRKALIEGALALAKVEHRPTLKPDEWANIPVWEKNLLAPENIDQVPLAQQPAPAPVVTKPSFPHAEKLKGMVDYISQRYKDTGNYSVDSKDIGIVASMLSKVFKNPEERHAVNRYLLGTTNTKNASPERILAMRDLFTKFDLDGKISYEIPDSTMALMDDLLDASRAYDGQDNVFDTSPSDEQVRNAREQTKQDSEQATEEQANKATRLMNREEFREKFKRSFNLTPEQADATMALMDAHAEIWGLRNGKDPAKYYSDVYDDIIYKDITKERKGKKYTYNTEAYTYFAENGKRVIKAFRSAEMNSGLHELGHIFSYDLTNAEIQTLIDWSRSTIKLDQYLAVNEAHRKQTPYNASETKKWERVQEKFAEGFVKYLKEGLAEDVATPRMQNVFAKFSHWLKTLYDNYIKKEIPYKQPIADIDKLKISPAMKELYDALWLRQDKADYLKATTEKLRSSPRGRMVEVMGVNNGETYNMQYGIVDVKDMITSHDINLSQVDLYAQELQRRLRDRAAYQTQMIERAENLDPRQLLWETRMTNSGPPIVGPDMMVESGNGRALYTLYAIKNFPDSYDGYTKALQGYLKDYGFTDNALEGIEHPMLVRIRMDDVDRIAFAEDANAEVTTRMSSTEEGLMDAGKIDNKLLAYLSISETNDIFQDLRSANNAKFRKAFFDKISSGDINQYVDAHGNLTAEGLNRIVNALVLKVFPGDKGTRIFEQFRNSIDPFAMNMQRSIEKTLSDMAKMEGLISEGIINSDMRITNDISDVLNAYLSIASSTEGWDNWIMQQSLFGEDKYIPYGLYEPDAPEVYKTYMQNLLHYFGENRNKQQPQIQLIKRYVNKLRETPSVQMTIGGIERLTKTEYMTQIMQNLVDEGISAEFLDFTRGADLQNKLFSRTIIRSLGLENTKVVDDSGKPLIVYHGTPEGYEGMPGFGYYGTRRPGKYGEGIYFSSESDFASSYAKGDKFEPAPAGTVYPVYLNLENPIIYNRWNPLLTKGDVSKLNTASGANSKSVDEWFRNYEYSWRSDENVRGWIIEAGYDGIIVYTGEGDRNVREYIAFYDEQVISAIPKQYSRTIEPVGDVPVGGTPVPRYDDAATYEVYQETLSPLLEEMERIANDDMYSGSAFSLEDIPDNLATEINNWLSIQVEPELASTKLASMRFGESMRNRALLNYSRRYGIDDVAQMFFPYEFWFTRTFAEWGKRMIEKPQWFSLYANIRKHQKRMEQEGIPSRLKGKVRLPAAYLPDWMGDALYIDPLKQLFPFSQFESAADQFAVMNQNIDYGANDIIRTWVKEGTAGITAKQAELAIKNQEGPIWEQAKALARSQMQETGEIDPMNVASYIMSPAMWWTYPYHMIKGNTEKLYPLPGTRFGQMLRTLGGPLGVIGEVMAYPEEAIRKKFNLNKHGEFGYYYINRQLVNLVADGVISLDEMNRAIIERKGDAFDMASERVAQEMALKMPGSQTLTAINEGKLGGVLYTLPSTLFPAGLLPEGEMKVRGLQELHSQAWDDYKNGNPKAINDFYNQYPEMEARTALFDTPEEQVHNFLVSEVWDRWTELDSKNKPLVAEQLGTNFERYFLENETRNYEAIDDETLAYWAQLLGGYVPETEQFADIKDMPMYMQDSLKLYSPQALEQVEAFYTNREQLFPDYSKLNELYFMLPETPKKLRREFLTENPQLKTAWEWKKSYYELNPLVKSYMDAQEERYNTNEALYTSAQTTDDMLDDIIIETMIPPLYMQLVFTYYSGQALSGGAKTMLMETWESYGSPGGDFKTWAESIMRKLVE